MNRLPAVTFLDAAPDYFWQSFDLSAYIGQSIQVYVIGREDYQKQTSFVVDDFEFNVQYAAICRERRRGHRPTMLYSQSKRNPGPPMRVYKVSDDRFHPLVEFSGAEAVFTFENSD